MCVFDRIDRKSMLSYLYTYLYLISPPQTQKSKTGSVFTTAVLYATYKTEFYLKALILHKKSQLVL